MNTTELFETALEIEEPCDSSAKMAACRAGHTS